MVHVTRRTALASALAASAAAVVPLSDPAPAAAAEPRLARGQTVYVAGDSTAGQKTERVRPEVGWGMALPWFLNARVGVANHALSGRSSKSFIDEGHLDTILARIQADDVLVIQFGHNDQKSQDPSLYTEPWSTYQEHLDRYITAARAAGALPVLATSAERRRFTREGVAYTTHGDYPAAMQALGEARGVPVIDVHAQTLALWQELGPEETKRYFLYTDDGRTDNTHFQAPGGSAIASMVVRGLVQHDVLHQGRVRRLDEPAPASWFTYLPAPEEG